MSIIVRTNKPIAYESSDHIHPLGTAYDNSTNLKFNEKLFYVFKAINVLDLGCSGGGFVKSILDSGCFAIGIEGSDYSKKNNRAEWGVIPENLFTADITEPFDVIEKNESREELVKFDVITAWEVLEHIQEEKLDILFHNIKRHLKEDGLVFFSVSWSPCEHGEIIYHNTVKDRTWWIRRLNKYGFVVDEGLIDYFGTDWVRGGNTDPMSYNLILRNGKLDLNYTSFKSLIESNTKNTFVSYPRNSEEAFMRIILDEAIRYIEERDYDRALSLLYKFENVHYKDAELQYQISFCLKQTNEYLEEASERCQYALQAGFYEEWARLNLGRLYIKIGKYKEARHEFNNLIEKYPQLKEAYEYFEVLDKLEKKNKK